MAAKTPARTLSAQKKATGSASGGKQQSILGFFNKGSAAKTTPTAPRDADSSPTCLKESTKTNFLVRPSRSTVTPVPSSDAIEPLSSQENIDSANAKVPSPALPSPVTPAEVLKQTPSARVLMSSSPTRKVWFPPQYVLRALDLTGCFF